MGKPDQAFSVALNAKQLLYADDSLFMDDLILSPLQIVFQRLDHLDLATGCYEHACSKFLSNLELMTGLFNCYVREYSFVKQQQTAIKMYKLVVEESFFLWAVCSIQLQVSDSNLIDWLNFIVFLNAWNLSSHELVHPDESGCRPRIWNILDSMLEKYILEKVRSIEPKDCSPLTSIELLMHVVTEPLAWHGLVIQSCLRSYFPSGKKKKKSGPAYQSSSNLAHAITDSIIHLSQVLEDVMKGTSEWHRRPEDEYLDNILFLQKQEHNDGPGKVFNILETFISSVNDVEFGDCISQSLKSWSPADVARKMTIGKLKVLMEFSAICKSKLKLLQSETAYSSTVKNHPSFTGAEAFFQLDKRLLNFNRFNAGG